MAEGTTTLLIRKNIRLGEDMHLIFDKEQDKYRAALYRPRRLKEQGHYVPRDVHEGMTKAAMLPAKPRDYWARFTGESKSLSTAISGVMGLAGLRKDTESVLRYLEGTEWGEHL